MRFKRREFVKAIGAAVAVASGGCGESEAGFESRWQGDRVWIGPEYWANPLQNWRTAGGEVFAQAGAGRTLHLLTHQAVDGEGGLSMEVAVRLAEGGDRDEAAETWAGFVVGIRGGLDGYKHALVHPATGVSAGVRGDGRLFVGEQTSVDAVSLEDAVELKLEADERRLKLTAQPAAGAPVSEETPVRAQDLSGNLALAAQASGPPTAETSGVEWAFRSWRVRGARIVARSEQTFGPILWSQYTLSRGVLQLAALFPPLGADDVWSARLEVRDGEDWKPVAEAPIEPLSRTAVLRVEDWDATRETPYRVAYEWQGREYQWEGKVRRDPVDGSQLRIGVFSCDHGECFPQTRMVRNVSAQDPDVVFFAGDQIYESHGGFGVARGKPAEEAMLDYLRKYWQHGWTWREILKDRPSIVIPDDHDVFQGNIWGQGGRALPPVPDAPRPMFEGGGFLMPVDWVNAVQRTQAGHLPDAVDPKPCESGIEVYFTELRYGGASFAVIEDRKFKTGPHAVLSEEQRAAAQHDPRAVDVPAEMLGARQEAWLARWVEESADAELRLLCSQTIFCKASTHVGGQLVRREIDLDSGGWPQRGRRRALEILQPARNLVMLHGDQHIGTLTRHGLDDWEDAGLSFMVPGTSNGFPRAWWPEAPGREPSADGAPEWTGRFRDGFGHRMTVLGAANPEPGSNTKEGQRGLDAEQVAHRKGSGYGMVVLDRETRTARFEMWRHGFDIERPGPEDQFEGFPIELPLEARLEGAGYTEAACGAARTCCGTSCGRRFAAYGARAPRAAHRTERGVAPGVTRVGRRYIGRCRVDCRFESATLAHASSFPFSRASSRPVSSLVVRGAAGRGAGPASEFHRRVRRRPGLGRPRGAGRDRFQDSADRPNGARGHALHRLLRATGLRPVAHRAAHRQLPHSGR